MKDLLSRMDRYGPALTALTIAAASCAYLAQAYLASSRLYNIIFLVPMVAAVVVLAIVVCIRMVLRTKADVSKAETQDTPESAKTTSETSNLAIVGLMAGLLIYAFAIPYVGFDVASALYMALGLWVLGERRITVVIGFSVVTAYAVTWLLVNGANVPAVTLIV